MRRAVAVVLLAAACTPAPSPYLDRTVAQSARGQQSVWLTAHNRERAAFGSAPLVWDEPLAAQARGYASELARLGRLQHSPKSLRPGQGENL